ncbi:sensor histidine kinase [Dictyobacter formicarum]|uniref:histidine kinase n=1 Tax=Dictyobacter formicarum TaxID=2778368 RepID=A0ABQ3VRT2_9CHLR|nr:GAF domain-containing sensor histidine kinase [Dictyobacter formicarum]GHO87826.1 hypothetical protein KSZ_58320 [Dictyobacter formicarum]
MQKLSRYNTLAAIFASMFVVICFVCLLLLDALVGLRAAIMFARIAVPVAALVGALWSWQVWYLAWRRPSYIAVRGRLAWFCIALGLLILCMRGVSENIAWYMYKDLYFLPIRDIISSLFYPCLFIGIIALPGMSSLRASMVVDVLITTCCLAGIYWYIVTILPVVVPPAGMLMGDWLPRLRLSIISLAGDIFLFLLLSLFWQQGVRASMRLALLLLSAGLAFNVLADASSGWFDAYSVLYYQHQVPWIDSCWIASLLLLGLSTLYQYQAQARKILSNMELTSSSEALAPDKVTHVLSTDVLCRYKLPVQGIYVPLALILGGLCVIEVIYIHQPASEAVDGLFIVSSIVGILIAMRHFFATRENAALLRERDQRFHEAEQVRYLVTQLADVLDLDSLCDRIMHVVLAQFGFTSVMLLLLEEYNQPVSERSHLLVNAASQLVQPLKCRVTGDSILYQLVAKGNERELLWSTCLNDLPGEVRRWQERQHIPTMKFFPIIYQGRILGSLGVARHILSRTDLSTTSMVRNYVDQIATVIEHSYLYQQAREREKFARAMVNISTRLNAAVIEPIELSQLICVEGARALHADYVIFYTRRAEGSLEPLAISIDGQQSSQQLSEWPPLRVSEYEQETAQPLHPFLLEVSPYRKMQLLTESSQHAAFTREHHPASRQFALRAKLIRHRIYTAILAPLVTGGRLNGLLIFACSVPLGSNTDLSFDESDIPHAQDFVEQASVAFTNARLYQRLSTANEQLKELDQMKDQFMVTASHELRTPLTAVQGYIELIAQYDEMLPAEQRREFLQKAQLGCEELEVLLRNVMDASRIEAETAIKPALISRVSVKEMLEKVMVMIEPQVTQDQRQVSCNVPSQLYVYADPLRLHQVLMNIGTNALKYSSAGTPLLLSAERSEEREKMVVISITDKGKGIAPQDQARIFQRFYRLESDMNSPIRGSGLGLYISRRLIEAMGGKIWIESRGIPGEGSTFHILLPMA